ncbi:unnamed protein product [Schistocephalus solidus]|uniref:SNF2_N domain-containing protein n=2 Tax=Schistocephalus solidus TaxID=70667 RepID=A0A183SS56_SCHSO|nr:unnamed protein product [Schistocephalus solidus]
MAVIIPNLAGLDDVTYCTSPRVTIFGSRSGQLNPFSSLITETEYRKFMNRSSVMTDRFEPGLELASSSTPPGGRWCRIEGSITELVRQTVDNMVKTPQSSFLDGMRYPRDTLAASADCLIWDEAGVLHSKYGPRAACFNYLQSSLIFHVQSSTFTTIEKDPPGGCTVHMDLRDDGDFASDT